MNTNYHHHASGRQDAISKLSADSTLPGFVRDMLLQSLGQLAANDTGQSVLVNASISASPNGFSVNAGVRYSAPLAETKDGAGINPSGFQEPGAVRARTQG